METRVKVIISGKVQGVGYRYFVYRKAVALGIKGWVRNLDTGHVEAVFEGSDPDVSTLLKACEKGPAMARVNGVDVVDDDSTEGFDGFDIR